MQEKSDTILIAQFFYDGTGTSSQEKVREMKQLTPEDKAQLGEGLRNGTLTY